MSPELEPELDDLDDPELDLFVARYTRLDIHIASPVFIIWATDSEDAKAKLIAEIKDVHAQYMAAGDLLEATLVPFRGTDVAQLEGLICTDPQKVGQSTLPDIPDGTAPDTPESGD